MKKIILLYSICSLIIYSCNFGKIYLYNPDEFIGKDILLLPNRYFYFTSDTYIEENRYFAYGFAYNRKKAIIYISNWDGYIIDYFYSNFLIYEKVKHIPTGTSVETIIKKLGRPAAIFDYKYIEIPNWENELPYSYAYMYLQYYKEEKGIYGYLISFCFDDNGKLVEINEFRNIV